MEANDSLDESESKPKYAVGLEHLFWVEADSREEAIKKGRKKLAELDEDDLRRLDMDVFDKDEF